MELAATESANTPKRYILDMSKDFVPMSVFSESSQGKPHMLACLLLWLLDMQFAVTMLFCHCWLDFHFALRLIFDVEYNLLHF